MSTDEQIERVERARIVRVNLREKIERVGGVGAQLKRTSEIDLRMPIVAAAQKYLAEVVENLEGSGLQSVGLFERKDGRFVLPF